MIPGFVDSHTPPGLRRRPLRGVRGADGRRAVRRPAASAPRSPRPGPRPTSSSPPTSPGSSPRCVRQGTTTVEIKSGYGLTVLDEARSLRDRAGVHRGDDVPRRARRARRAPTTADDYVDLVTGAMLEACAPHARWIDVFCERRRVRRRPGPQRCSTPGIAAGLRPRVHANQLRPGPGRPARRRARRRVAPTTARTSADADVDALRRLRHRRHPAAGRRVLDPSPYPDARRLIDAGVTVALATDCNPGSQLHRRRCRSASRSPCARCGMTPDEALWAATAGRRAGAAPRRRRPSRRRRARPTSSCSTRPSLHPPGLPPRRAARGRRQLRVG